MQRKFFWKLALTFLALLLSVLLAVDFFAERALRNSYETEGYQQLKGLARLIGLHPLPLSNAAPQTPEDTRRAEYIGSPRMPRAACASPSLPPMAAFWPIRNPKPPRWKITPSARKCWRRCKTAKAEPRGRAFP